MAEGCYDVPVAAVGTAAAMARALPEDAVWYPAATRRPIPRNYGGPLASSRGLVLHVQEGRNSLYGWFGSEAARASSHWWVSAAGEVEQYVPADVVAWAQGAGNRAWHSVETAGYHTEPLTAAQVRALAELYRWGAERWGWPLRLAETPDGTGLGWHGMGAPGWGHSVCPGVARRGQRAGVLDLATGEDLDVAVVDELVGRLMAELAGDGTAARRVRQRMAADVLAALRAQVFDVAPPIRQGNAGQVIGATYNKVGDLQASAGRILAGVEGLQLVDSAAVFERLGRIEADVAELRAALLPGGGVG